MTRRRNVRPQHVAASPKIQPLTFRQAWSRLIKVIKFRVLPSEYLNKKVLYKGKYRKIEGETVDFFFIAEFPKQAFPKVGNRLKIK
jgi:hypothetical protein